MDSAKRKILPQRYNRGLRMAELEKNEAKLNENEQYNEIFKEDSSDDEFDPAVQEHVEDAEEDDDDDDVDNNVTSNDNELPNDDDVSYHSMIKHKKHVEEIIDIDQLDIDKIDYIEDLRDRGIEISDEDALDPRDRFSSIGNSDDDEDDEDYGKHHRNKKFNKAKAKKKAKNKAKKKGKVKKGNKDEGLFPITETGGVVVDDSNNNNNNNNLALTEDNNVISSSNLNEQHKAQSLQNVIVSTTKHNETIIIIPKSLLNINFDNVQFNKNILNVNEQQQQHDNITILNQKRIRTNKYADLIKKPKREKINKNVTILGSRNNPRSILINKNIYNEKDESQDYNDNNNNNNNISKSTLQHQSNSTNTNNILSFALEQEMDTKDLIRKIRQQEKEKKFGFQDKIISQEQRLFESIFTEWANKHSLQAMQKLEDLNKRENTTSNKKSFLDYVKISNSQKHIIAKQNGNATIDNAVDNDEHIEHPINNTIKDINKVNVTFSNMTYYNKVFAFFNTKPKEKELKKCAITGEPARYYDPLTKSYYSSMDAFKLLREKYFQKEEDGLLFRIQTLSDLASQKKERVKKMIWIDNTNTINAISSSNNNNHQNSIEQIKQGMRETNTNAIMNIVNKYGIWRADGDNEKRVISHRIYNRNRENCVESGMLLEASKIKLVISKKIFKDKFSSKIPT